MFEITKDTIIAQILIEAPDTAPLFQEIGMHCLGCALASDETVEEACMVHGIDADSFIEKLNNFIMARV
jgi:hydrid cluster protein-associated redox disulfide domain